MILLIKLWRIFSWCFFQSELLPRSVIKNAHCYSRQMSLNPSFQSQSMSILLQIKLFRFGELRPLPSSWGQFSPFFGGGNQVYVMLLRRNSLMKSCHPKVQNRTSLRMQRWNDGGPWSTAIFYHFFQPMQLQVPRVIFEAFSDVSCRELHDDEKRWKDLVGRSWKGQQNVDLKRRKPQLHVPNKQKRSS